jgi:acetyl esterase/lipase
MVTKGLERITKLLLETREIAAKKRVKDARHEMEHMANSIQLPADVEINEIIKDGIQMTWLKTPDVIEDRVIMYLHGGTYFAGSFKTHKDLIQRLSRESRCRVLALEYGLAPEHPFPEGLNDTIKTYEWLINDKKIHPNRIIFAGDSAGGGLAIATLLKLRDLNKPLPAAVVCLSPWTDLTFQSDSYYDNKILDPRITLDGLMFGVGLYVGDNDPRNPYISPIYGDLNGLPPLLIHVGTTEKLLDDSIRLADNAKKAGVDVTLKIWQDMIHVFQVYAVLIPEGNESIREIGIFIQNKIG